MAMTPQTTTKTAILRPSRRPLLFMGPLVGAEFLLVVALVFARALGFERATFSLLALFIPFGLLMLALVTRPLSYVLVMLSGRTEVGPDGVVNRTVTGSSRISWQEIRSVDVRRSLFGRKVFAVLRKRRRRVPLAAPRDGLLAPADGFDSALAVLRESACAAGVPITERPRLSRRVGWTVLCATSGLLLAPTVFLTRPWLDPWWPGRHEVTRTPHACDIPGIEPIVPVLHKVAGYYSSKAQESTCTWMIGTTHREGDSRLKVWLIWDRRSFTQDAERNAHDDFTLQQGGERYKPVPGLGDEAAEDFTLPDSSGVWGDVIVRRANMVIRVSYGAKRPGDQVAATAEHIARVITDQLPVN